MTTPFAGLPGAVVAESGPDVGAVWHYGNPLGEQRALAEGRAVVALKPAVLTVSGPDRLSWLNSMSSQLLLGLQPGDSSETLLLDPSGRIEHAVRLVEDGERLWLLTERGEAAGLVDFLNRMRFMLRVEVEDVTASHAVIGSTAPLYAVASSRAESAAEPAAATAAPDGAATVVWHDPWSSVAPGGHQYAAVDHDYTTWSWYETIVTRDFALGLVGRAASG
ncbi:MAG: folate-binding protein, partial [Microbacteriaceae bacterium]|nr:folate-binding protein [Microbacteriaceae bacterium]